MLNFQWNAKIYFNRLKFDCLKLEMITNELLIGGANKINDAVAIFSDFQKQNFETGQTDFIKKKTKRIRNYRYFRSMHYFFKL